MRECIIVDIDGTLADCSKRRSFAQKADGKVDFSRFYQDMEDDEPRWMVNKVVRLLSPVVDIIIYVTGRPEEYRKVTNEWLYLNVTNFASYVGGTRDKVCLFMRADGDYRPDTVVKQEIYERHIKDKFKVMLVLDDRARVVDMWRNLGLECWQVDVGNF